MITVLWDQFIYHGLSLVYVTNTKPVPVRSLFLILNTSLASWFSVQFLQQNLTEKKHACVYFVPFNLWITQYGVRGPLYTACKTDEHPKVWKLTLRTLKQIQACVGPQHMQCAWTATAIWSRSIGCHKTDCVSQCHVRIKLSTNLPLQATLLFETTKWKRDTAKVNRVPTYQWPWQWTCFITAEISSWQEKNSPESQLWNCQWHQCSSYIQCQLVKLHISKSFPRITLPFGK